MLWGIGLRVCGLGAVGFYHINLWIFQAKTTGLPVVGFRGVQVLPSGTKGSPVTPRPRRARCPVVGPAAGF